MISYHCGRFIDSSELAFPVLSDMSGTVRGYRIFTACRTQNGKIFHLEDHVDRLFVSAFKIFMEIKETEEELVGIVMDLLLRNRNSGELLFEMIYSGGPVDESGVTPSGPAQLTILAVPLKTPPSVIYENGLSVATFQHQRPFASVKLLHYVGGIVARKTVVKEHQADHPLFISEEKDPIILEGDTFNVFCVRNGVVYTPQLDNKILSGITRKIVLSLCEKKGLEAKERQVFASEIASFDECFLTSSTRAIVPIVRINQHTIGSGVPGMITRTLMDTFNDYLTQY